MAQPQPGYPPQGYSTSDQYAQEAGEQYENGFQAGSEGAAQQIQGESSAPTGKERRKRQYAGQAYDFGAGANSATGGQHNSSGSFSGPPGGGYGGYESQLQQPGLQQPAYGGDYGSSAPARPVNYGLPTPTTIGYHPPGTGYPAQGATSMSGGVGGITQGMNNMGIGGQTPQNAQSIPPRPHLNQLYPTDLLNQPFNVTELDLPPPPIILPPNVSDKV